MCVASGDDLCQQSELQSNNKIAGSYLWYSLAGAPEGFFALIRQNPAGGSGGPPTEYF